MALFFAGLAQVQRTPRVFYTVENHVNSYFESPSQTSVRFYVFLSCFPYLRYSLGFIVGKTIYAQISHKRKGLLLSPRRFSPDAPTGDITK